MNNIIKRVWNQNRLVNIEDLTGMVFQAEAGGHTFEISGVDDEGNAVALSGSVAGVFRRPDNADIALTGAASDGVVSVTLSADCYAVPGRFALTIFVTSGSQTVAVYAAVGTVAATSGGSVAGDTPESVADLIADIEAAVATIPPTYTDLMASIAPTYSSSALYAVGSYAWYDGDLYRCTTPITTAESWTAAHWTAAVLGDDVGDLKSAINEITETYEPTNYGSASADNLVIASSGLVGNVTATNNANGGVDLANSSGVNGTVAFDLSALPYKQKKNLRFAVSIQNYKGTPSLDLRRSVSSGSVGAVIASLALDSQTGEYVYDWNNFQNYNYTVLGDVFLGYSLRYNQTTAVTIKLTVKEIGDVEKLIISPDAIEDIGYDNLSDDFKASLSVVSGDKPTLYGGKQVSVFNKGVAIGDSLTAGVFNYNEGGSTGYSTIASFSFPAKLAQLTGIDVTNLGNGGYTSDQWWDAHKDDDLSGNKFAIIQLGVNDAIQYSSWTQTSITAFTNIINKILTENTGIFVFVSTIIPATSYMGTAFAAVSEGIRDLVEDINDDHVILLDMAEYGNTADETGYNNGHLSALGYERLALDYISYISYVIAQNPVLFRNIQFIGTNHSYS